MARVEIISGPARRRHWTDEQKRTIVAHSFAPGAVVNAAARRAEVCPGQIYRWQQEFREMTETSWQSYSRAAPERDYVALLSYLPLNSVWSLPRLVLYSTRIQRQLRTSSGLIGYSLRARLAAKQFWTLSVWEDGADLQAFVAAPPHLAVMTAMAPYMGATRFVRWNVRGSELPLRWDDALRRD